MRDKKIYIVNVLIFLLIFTTNAQKNENCGLKYNRKSQKLLTIADTLNRKGSSKALSYYRQAFIKDTHNVHACYQLAIINYEKYLIAQYDPLKLHSTNTYVKKAEFFFLKTIHLCRTFKQASAFYYLGELYFLEKKYPLAQHFFEKYINHCKSIGKPINANVLNYFEKCKLWEKLEKNTSSFHFYALQKINTEASEQNPSLSQDGEVILFTRRYNKTYRNSMFTVPVKEVFMAEIGGIDSLGMPIYENEKLIFEHDAKEKTTIGSYCFSSDKRHIYFTLCHSIRSEVEFVEDCDIYVLDFDGYVWGNARPLSEINKKFTFEGNPCLSPDDKTLYFVSNHYDGYGGKDIFYTRKDEQGKWGKPINLGSNINTLNDEIAPFIAFDNRTLYFSSNGHFGLGGFDIFYSYGSDSTWQQPKNLGKPYNSSADEKHFVADATALSGYKSSRRNSTFGGHDILKIKIPKPYQSKKRKSAIHIKIDVAQEKVTNELINPYLLTLDGKKKIKLSASLFNDKIYTAMVENTDFPLFLSFENERFLYANKIISADSQNFIFQSIKLLPKTFHLPFEIIELNAEKWTEQPTMQTLYLLDDFSKYLIVNNLKINILSYYDNLLSNAKQIAENKAKFIQNYLLKRGVKNTQIRLSVQKLGEPNGKKHIWFELF